MSIILVDDRELADYFNTGRPIEEISTALILRLLWDWPTNKSQVKPEWLEQLDMTVDEFDRRYAMIRLHHEVVWLGAMTMIEAIEVIWRLDQPSIPNHQLFESVARAFFPRDWQYRLGRLYQRLSGIRPDKDTGEEGAG